MVGSSPPQARWCQLPPEPTSAGTARRFVGSALAGVDPELRDTAQLLTSELVTNAVLHSGTELELGVWASPERVHVSVFDRAPDAPIRRRDHDVDAATGRGLQLVEALASAYGTETFAEGKTVWFEMWSGDAPASPSHWGDERRRGARAGNVVLAGMPVGLCRAAGRHRRSVLREGRLTLSGAPGDVSVTPGDLQEAASLGDLIDSEMDGPLGELAGEQVTFDCTLRLPRPCGGAAKVLAEVLDALDGAASAGLLLTRPALPEIRRFRVWLLDQIAAQLADPGAAEAWSGSKPAEQGPAGPLVGSDRITDLGPPDRAAVAADDDGRIMAISAQAEQLLGWRSDELAGQRLVTIVPEGWRDRHVAGFTEFLLSGRSRIIGRPTRLPVRRRDGTVFDAVVEITVGQSVEGRTVFVARMLPAG